MGLPPGLDRLVPVRAAERRERGREQPVLLLADVLVQLDDGRTDADLVARISDVDRRQQLGHLAMLPDQRRDVVRVLLVSRHGAEDAVLLALPVRAQLLRHGCQLLAGGLEVAAVESADRVTAEVRHPLVLGDVVPDQGDLPASAVVAHLAPPFASTALASVGPFDLLVSS